MLSDSQIRQISKASLLSPLDVAQAESEKTSAVVAQSQELERDNANKIFYDMEKAAILNYFAEIKSLNGFDYAEYSDANLEAAAKQSPGSAHYPSDPIWTSFKPKVLAANTGLPVAQISDHELSAIGLLQTYISLMKTGFVGSAGSVQTAAAWNGSGTMQVSASVSVGSKIMISNGSSALYATVSSVTTNTGVPPASNTYSLGLDVIILAGSIPSGSTVLLQWSGLTDSQRQGDGSPYQGIFGALKTYISNQVTTWITRLTEQKTSLGAQGLTGIESTQANTALTNVVAAQSVLNSWTVVSNSGIGGKYTDTGISSVETLLTTRQNQVSSRIAEINTNLGTLSQNPDGSYQGSGHFLSFFKWIDFRASKSGGTLTSYYGAGMLIGFADAKIQTAQTKSQEFTKTMIVTQIKGFQGSDEVTVADVTGFSPNDTVRVFDEEIASGSIQIISIAGDRIKLSLALSGFDLAKQVRLVKLL